MVTRKLDSIWIDLTLRHPSCEPEEITKALGIQPWHSAKAGQEMGPSVRKSAVWMAHYREGLLNNHAFAKALEDLCLLLSGTRDFLLKFYRDGGEATLVVNQQVAADDGVVFDLSLRAFLLQTLGEHGIGLQVKAWIVGEEETLHTDI